MDELFHQLEKQIKSLLLQHKHLQQEHTTLTHDKKMLSQKNQQTISQIEAMIQRLKSIEKIA